MATGRKTSVGYISSKVQPLTKYLRMNLSSFKGRETLRIRDDGPVVGIAEEATKVGNGCIDECPCVSRLVTIT